LNYFRGALHASAKAGATGDEKKPEKESITQRARKVANPPG